jgi:hypothetical protein
MNVPQSVSQHSVAMLSGEALFASKPFLGRHLKAHNSPSHCSLGIVAIGLPRRLRGHIVGIFWMGLINIKRRVICCETVK